MKPLTTDNVSLLQTSIDAALEEYRLCIRTKKFKARLAWIERADRYAGRLAEITGWWAADRAKLNTNKIIQEL